jgi:hypothetical protein
VTSPALLVPRRTLWLVLLTCAVPRLAALAIFRERTPTLYSALAESLVAGRGYTLDGETATWLEPLYPALLAVGRWLGGEAGMLALQIAVASLGGVALFSLAARRAGTRVAWLTTLLYALSPYLVRQSAAFMEIPVATALAIATVWSLDRLDTGGGAAVAGGLIAALLLTRASFLPIGVAAVMIAWRAGASRALAVTAVTAAGLLPWILFTETTTGTLLPPRTGENLFVSTSEWAEPLVPRVNVDVILPITGDLVERELGPSASRVERDRFLLHRALAFIRAHPVRALALKARNLGCVFLPRLLPFTERRGSAAVVDGVLRIPPQAARPLAYEIVGGAFQGLLMVGAAAGMWKRRYHLLRDDAGLSAVAVSVVAINVVFFPTSRLLAPMSFVLMFYTAASVDRRREVTRER